jgi:hypothetical protein
MTRIEPGAPIQARGLPIRWCNGARSVEGQTQTSRLIRSAFRMSLLCALKRDQHTQITCTFLTKGDERLLFRRIVPSVEGIHVWELYDCDPFWFPMSSLRHFMASALCQVAPAVLRDHRPDLGPVFLEFGRVGDDVFNN